LLPPLYIAYRTDLAQGSEVFHNNIRERYLRGDPEILDAIRFWVELTDKVRAALLAGKGNTIGPLLNANFDMRAKIYRIGPGNLRMVEAARSTGASAKFTGSGGAIIGTYEDENMFKRLKAVLEPMNIQVIRPVIVPASE
ncbi:MAG: GHMP kinase, partial [Kiritimatiellae bacterium]|nr:GHMP kinase [Kiritimatiellia bacterium]